MFRLLAVGVPFTAIKSTCSFESPRAFGVLAQVVSHQRQELSLGLLLTTRQLVCAVADSCQKKLHIQITKCFFRHVIDRSETHLEVSKDHFSVHVAIAAYGGHGDDWRKAIPLPLVLVASRLEERHKLWMIKLLVGAGDLKVGNFVIWNFVRIQTERNYVKNCCKRLLSRIILTHCFYGRRKAPADIVKNKREKQLLPVKRENVPVAKTSCHHQWVFFLSKGLRHYLILAKRMHLSKIWKRTCTYPNKFK